MPWPLMVGDGAPSWGVSAAGWLTFHLLVPLPHAANLDRLPGRTPTAAKLPTVAWMNGLPRSTNPERLTPKCLIWLDGFR